MNIEKDRHYVYIGPDNGKGEVHTLIYKGRDLITQGHGINGAQHSFLGDTESFVKCFRELEEAAA